MDNAEKDETASLWDISIVVAERVDVVQWAVNNTIQLFEEDNSVPFIARYRKEQTNNMEADKIRDLKEVYDELKCVQSRSVSIIKAVEKMGKMTRELKDSLRAAQSSSEVEHLYAPYKAGSKRSLAERARDLGLEPVTLGILKNPHSVNLQNAVMPNKEGLSSLTEVETGIKNILADMISKDKDTMDEVRKLCLNAYVMLKTAKSKTAKVNENKVKKVEPKAAKVKTESKVRAKVGNMKQTDIDKFNLYFDFSIPLRHVKPHQVLAINRGENLKVLTVKIDIPDQVKHRFDQFCQRKWEPRGANAYIQKLVKDCVQDAYSRLIEPLMIRHFRSELSKKAEKAAVEVFASNLKRLLLSPPVRGKVVLGVDPGFKNGCKFAVTSPTGAILDSGVAYLHDYRSRQESEMDKIRCAVQRHRCETVGIGNGTACRETEACFADHIKRGMFLPLKVKFCIVNESGASIYSASDEAKKEMPDLDINIRGAVSLCRRLQDPLAELVKIDPKHIGVGMYQHDVAGAHLKTALDGVVEDCVSFVGVDINTCSEPLLRRIAGLNATQAKKIVEHREKNAAFLCREQLNSIKGLGPKTFKQCAGFIRVMPETRGGGASGGSEDAETPENTGAAKVKAAATGTKRKPTGAKGGPKSKKAKTEASLQANPLDMTAIHPESYHLANRLLELMVLDKDNIGQAIFIQAVNKYMKCTSLERLADELGAGVPTVKLIVEGLQQSVGHDLRDEFEKPLFKEGLMSIQDVKAGSKLTGKVVNMTHFGAFVDVGVGQDGLIHTSQMNPCCMRGKRALELGDRVEATVINVDINRKRLGLRLQALL